MKTDTLQRFMLERAQVRGEWLRLESTWQALLARAPYPETVRKILGEALSAAVLLSATLKHDGALVLQVHGNGPIHLLVIQANAQGTVRGLARWSHEPTDTSLAGLFGEAQLVITVESHQTNERYQSLIALEGDTLSQALEGYFARSEQLPTRLWLMADADIAGGLLLQRLPGEYSDREDWQRVSLLLNTLTPEEFRHLDAEDTLFRLFHEEDVRVFTAQPISFQCTCSRARVEDMLRSLGQAEAEAAVQEQGKIEITCDFCNASYTLDAVDIGQLFKPTMPANDTLH
ncbi:MAG: Hsp33 family molecular chaperone HslO [Thiothrix sp.]